MGINSLYFVHVVSLFGFTVLILKLSLCWNFQCSGVYNLFLYGDLKIHKNLTKMKPFKSPGVGKMQQQIAILFKQGQWLAELFYCMFEYYQLVHLGT